LYLFLFIKYNVLLIKGRSKWK